MTLPRPYPAPHLCVGSTAKPPTLPFDPQDRRGSNRFHHRGAWMWLRK